MSVPFERTLRAVRQGESFALRLVLWLAGAGAGLGLAWSVIAEVPIYAVSREASLEAEGSPHLVVSQVGGRIRGLRVALGQPVAPGELLFELEAARERGALAAEEARRRGLASELESLGAEAKALGATLGSTRTERLAAIEQARALPRAAEEAESLATEEAESGEQLHAAGLFSEAEWRHREAELEMRRAETAAARAEVQQVDAERRREVADGGRRWAELQRELTAARRALEASERTLEGLRAEVEWRAIRSPVAGWVAELGDAQVGSVVEAGERLGVIVPAVELGVVAWFEPSASLGRVRPGQEGKLRLAGFPWMEYGSIPLRVIRVASEPRKALVRVELAVALRGAVGIPRQHGLPGEVLVVVERLSPARLLLRSVGRAASGAKRSDPQVRTR